MRSIGYNLHAPQGPQGLNQTTSHTSSHHSRAAVCHALPLFFYKDALDIFFDAHDKVLKSRSRSKGTVQQLSYLIPGTTCYLISYTLYNPIPYTTLYLIQPCFQVFKYVLYLIPPQHVFLMSYTLYLIQPQYCAVFKFWWPHSCRFFQTACAAKTNRNDDTMTAALLASRKVREASSLDMANIVQLLQPVMAYCVATPASDGTSVPIQGRVLQ